MNDYKKEIDKLKRDVRGLSFSKAKTTKVVTENTTVPVENSVIMGKPIQEGMIPKEGQVLTYDELTKTWRSQAIPDVTETDPVFTAWDKDYNDLINKPTIPTVSDIAYDAGTWNANTDAPSKNAVRDKIESILAGGFAFTNAIWTGNTRIIESDTSENLSLNDELIIINNRSVLTAAVELSFANIYDNEGKRIIVYVYSADETYDTVLYAEDNGFIVGNADIGASININSLDNGKTLVFQWVGGSISRWIQLYPDKHII